METLGALVVEWDSKDQEIWGWVEEWEVEVWEEETNGVETKVTTLEEIKEDREDSDKDILGHKNGVETRGGTGEWQGG